ncbi:MAG TPA: class I SAM-dependent methyltransferase [Lacunisphaera sp.]|nr:class I SAM-dependent methyltransferase [Lacunisphaera sp.]
MSSNFQDHFSAVAAKYGSYRPTYPDELFAYLARVSPAGATVWDCAAGNGQASRSLADHFTRVVATDASAQQIAAAPAHPRIEYRVAPAEASGLPDASVGLVTVAQALHWFDLPKFYAEVRRVLVPSGVLAVWCYGINEVEGATVNRIVQHYYGNTLDVFWPRSRRLVEAGYQTLPFPFPELTAPQFKMETRWTLEQLLGYFSTWSATNAYIKANGRNPLEPLREELAPAWGDPQSPRTIAWPLSLRLGLNPGV